MLQSNFFKTNVALVLSVIALLSIRHDVKSTSDVDLHVLITHNVNQSVQQF